MQSFSFLSLALSALSSWASSRFFFSHSMLPLTLVPGQPLLLLFTRNSTRVSASRCVAIAFPGGGLRYHWTRTVVKGGHVGKAEKLCQLHSNIAVSIYSAVEQAARKQYHGKVGHIHSLGAWAAILARESIQLTASADARHNSQWTSSISKCGLLRRTWYNVP